MNRAATRALPVRERLRQTEAELAALRIRFDAVQDVVNAILEQAGGTVTVSMDHVLAARRRPVETIGMGHYIIVTTKADEILAPKPKVAGIRRLLPRMSHD